MKKLLGAFVAAAALGVAAGCATANRQAPAAQEGYPTPEIASLERALADAQDASDLPRLLLARGHAYLVEGESWLKGHPGDEERRRGYERYAGHFLRAITDFETIVLAHGESPEAAEAMFHLGVVYDHPNITNYQVALSYYLRTIEGYPETEWARNAQRAVDDIRDLFHQMYRDSHGL
jgi:hypothetical protein